MLLSPTIKDIKDLTSKLELYIRKYTLSPIYKAKRQTALLKTRKRRRADDQLANTSAALLIIKMLMNCIFNQINGAFHNYLSLYIGDNDNNTTYCLFVVLVANVT